MENFTRGKSPLLVQRISILKPEALITASGPSDSSQNILKIVLTNLKAKNNHMDPQEIKTSHLFWKQNTNILKQKWIKLVRRGPIYYCGLHE